jgi:hypothetical protein
MKALYTADQGWEANPTGLDDQKDLGIATDLSLPPVNGNHVRSDVDAGGYPFLNQAVSNRLPDLPGRAGDQHHEASRPGPWSGFA